MISMNIPRTLYTATTRGTPSQSRQIPVKLQMKALAIKRSLEELPTLAPILGTEEKEILSLAASFVFQHFWQILGASKKRKDLMVSGFVAKPKPGNFLIWAAVVSHLALFLFSAEADRGCKNEYH